MVVRIVVRVSESSLFEFLETVFGASERGRPSPQFLRLLQLYSAGAEVFASHSGSEGYQALWVAGDTVGALSVAGNAADAPINGAVCAVASLGTVKLGAEFRDAGFDTLASPSIALTLSDDIEVQVGSGHHNGEAFITELLARMRRVRG